MAIFHHPLAFVDWNPSQVTLTSSPFDMTPVVFVTSYKDTVAQFRPCLWHMMKRVSLVPDGMVWPSSVLQCT